jgi:PAS domain S-box-containing protein
MAPFSRKETERSRRLLKLYEKAWQLSDRQLYEYALDHAVRLTDSTIGFFHLVSDDQREVMLTVWNSEALKSCTAVFDDHYPIERAGNWVDCVRLKRPVIYNDFPRSPNRKGLPSGHAPLRRFMSIPVMEEDKVRIIFGVGNKAAKYDEQDVVQIQLVASELQKIIRQRRAEEALRTSELKYRQFFENVSDSLFLLEVTPDGRFRNIEQNRAFEQSTGLPRSQLLGKYIEETVPEETARIATDKYRRCVESGTTTDEVVDLDLPTGRRTFHSTLVPVRDAGGRIYRIIGISRDITESRRAAEILRASEEKYRTLIQKIRAAVVVHGADTRVLGANPTAQELLGMTEDQMVGKTARDPDWRFSREDGTPLPPDDYPVNRVLSSRQSVRNATMGIHRPGTEQEVWVLVNSDPIFGPSGEVNEVIVTFVDISERRRLEIEHARVNRALRMRSATSQALIRFTEETALLQEVCRIAVDVGGYLMAWVAFAEHDEAKSLRPVAHAGLDSGYTQSARLSWADNERGAGPGGIAIRTRQPAVARNALANPSFAPWLEAARERGFQSVIALPLLSEGQSLGVISIYSAERNAFDPQEVEILKEIADDLSYGISALRIREQHDRAENALRETEAKYRLIAENTADTIAVLDMSLRPVYVSPSVLRLRGYTTEEAMGQGLEDTLTPESVRIAKQAFADQMAQEGKATSDPSRVLMLELEQKRKDGSTIWVELAASFLRDESSRPTAVLTVTRDITRRKQAETGLVRLTHAIEQSPVSVIITNARGDIEYVNPKFTEITGYRSDEVKGKNPRILKSGETSTEEYRQLWAAIIDGRVWRGEFHNRKKNGELFWESASISPVRDAKGATTHFIAIKEDITPRKLAEEELKRNEARRRELERELIQAQKLESLGTLAGGVAHDFNNLLAIISGQSFLLKSDRGDPAKMEHRIDAITRAAERGASLVRQLLVFARRSEAVFVLVSMNQIAVEITKLLRETVQKTIVVSTDLKPGIPPVFADATQIHQVLLNLCVNARDAMPNGGTLTIATSMAEHDFMAARFPRATAPAYVGVSVRDTGVGMDEETKRKIFDPFFTTKGPGKGTGLGLALVHSIVETHHGMIGVESAPGKGSTFALYFPAAERRVESREHPEALPADEPGGTETILLIEDERVLSEMVKEVLTGKGYRVVTAFDGEEGVQKYLRHREQIALVLSDMGLPKFGGDEVFRRIRAIDPKARVILASGMIEPEVMAEMLGGGIRLFIQKPYSAPDVLRAVRRTIDEGE